MEGRKDDQGKTRIELIPPSLVFAVGDILTFGAKKYADRNWEQGIKWSRVFGGLMRHMWSWWRGENLDPETGKSHLWHAACCLAFLIEYETTHPELDDRPNTKPAIAPGAVVPLTAAEMADLKKGIVTAAELVSKRTQEPILWTPGVVCEKCTRGWKLITEWGPVEGKEYEQREYFCELGHVFRQIRYPVKEEHSWGV